MEFQGYEATIDISRIGTILYLPIQNDLRRLQSQETGL
jgi:hypothetical protein